MSNPIPIDELDAEITNEIYSFIQRPNRGVDKQKLLRQLQVLGSFAFKYKHEVPVLLSIIDDLKREIDRLTNPAIETRHNRRLLPQNFL
jgi:hypothetical protein